ncbi:hypothetical protein ACHAW5_009497 [Stephanodiscus triporus]|uniref:Uncharacterized protein n=1 Tax=Stephanodiscus triporus TaxID=2934178 RepID=A0ABD3PYP4_9STRA
MTGRSNDREDLSALVNHIRLLEISLAKKDELLATKDRRIDELEARASATTKNGKKTESTNATEDSDRTASVYSTLNRAVVSDDSGDAAVDDDDDDDEPTGSDAGGEESPSSSILLLGLSRISRGSRSWGDEDTSKDDDDNVDVMPADGRWNIPFDYDDDVLGHKESASDSPPDDGRGGPTVGFVPIGEGGRVLRPLSARTDFVTTPSRPLATRRGHDGAPSARISPLSRPPTTWRGLCSGAPSPRSKTMATRRNLSGDSATNEKENVSPSGRIGSIVIGALFDTR